MRRKFSLNIVLLNVLTLVGIFSGINLYSSNILYSKDDSFRQVSLFSMSINQTSIKSELNYKNGNFFSPLGLDNCRGLKIEVESYRKINQWNLYGTALYSNSFMDESQLALMYPINYEENPIFLFQNHSSQWNLQGYDLNVAINRSVGRKKNISFGYALKYSGLSTFKRTDIRNEETNLLIENALGVSCRLSMRWKIALDVFWKRVKNKPNLSVKYNHNSNDDAYKAILNLGMGKIKLNPGYDYLIKTDEPKVNFSVLRRGEKSISRYGFTLSSFSTIWDDESIKNIEFKSENYKFSKSKFGLLYDYKSVNFDFLVQSFYNNGESSMRKTYDGNLEKVYADRHFDVSSGFIWKFTNDSGDSQRVFDSRTSHSNPVSQISQRSSEGLQSLEVDLGWKYSSMHDMSYGMDFMLSKYHLSLKTLSILNLKSNKYFEVMPSLSGMYIQDLTDYKKPIVTKFDELLGDKYRKYMSTSTVDFQIYFSYNVRKNNLINLFLDYDYRLYVGEGICHILKSGVKFTF